MNLPAERKQPVDLEAIARRIIELADLSVAEHLAAIARSQADALMELAGPTTPRELRPNARVWR